MDDQSLAHPAHTTTDPTTRAGDPFVAAAKRRGCLACYEGLVFMGGEDADGQPFEEAVPCRRCSPEYR